MTEFRTRLSDPRPRPTQRATTSSPRLATQTAPHRRTCPYPVCGPRVPPRRAARANAISPALVVSRDHLLGASSSLGGRTRRPCLRARRLRSLVTTTPLPAPCRLAPHDLPVRPLLPGVVRRHGTDGGTGGHTADTWPGRDVAPSAGGTTIQARVGPRDRSSTSTRTPFHVKHEACRTRPPQIRPSRASRQWVPEVDRWDLRSPRSIATAQSPSPPVLPGSGARRVTRLPP